MKKCLVLAVNFLFACVASANAQTVPLMNAHAHNDYEHARPLLDALEQGFCSVEADIWLVDGKFLVGHTRAELKPERTLQALYLDPLRERVKKNGGSVYPKAAPFTLLIDVKTDGATTYTALRELLKDYADILTKFTPKETETKAITAILSGNRSAALLAKEEVRFAAIDGSLKDLESDAPVNLIPLVSENWTKVFKWRGSGAFPDDERERLKQLVAQAHKQGRRIRFWAAPDNAEGWKELRDAGVDLINTDNLAGLKEFLTK